MRTRLLIKDQTSGEYIDVPLVNDIPVSITYQQADVREPDKRNSSFSKSIEIYASNEINILFENLFDVNIVTNTFNPNKKSQCKYLADEIEQFNGALQLIKIVKKPDNNIVYVCNINGNEGNIFIDIGDKLLTDLDFSEYNHTYNRTNILNSWSNYMEAQGYYYPFVDNGTNGGSLIDFKVEQFIPCFHAKEYIDKIIADAGYTYNSTFLNSSDFTKNIIYPNISKIDLSNTQLQNRQFYVGLNSNSSITTQPISVITAGNFYNLYSTHLVYNRESSPFYDNASPTMFTSGVGTINDNGKYNLTATVKTRLIVTKGSQDPSYNYLVRYGYSVLVSIEKSSDNGSTWFGLVAPIIQHQVQQNPDESFNYFTVDPITEKYERDFVSQAQTGSIQLSQGDKIRVKYIVFYDGQYITQVKAAPSFLGDFTPDSVTHTMLSGSNGTSFSCLTSSNELSAGNTVDANQCLPKNIKQKDFFKSILQMYNLFIDFNKDNPTELTIEPYANYFRLTEGGDSIVDWANKIDRDNPFEVNPLFLLEGREYQYTYKSDKDYYNQRYEREHDEIFGQQQIIIDNDFLTQTKKTELIFSPTPNSENYAIGAIYPRIYEDTGTEIKPVTSNIRILHVNNTLTTSNPYNFHDSSVGNSIQTTAFGYAGHCDDPLVPNVDLNFDFPKSVYYTYPALSFTTNNLYNKYHKLYLENITSRDSKTVVANLWLNSLDISKFTFRKKYFIDGAYYLVNKIIDFNPLLEKSTKVELIKLLSVTAFTPQRIDITNDGTINRGDITLELMPVDNRVINYSTTVDVLGSSDIFVSADSSNSVLINSRNVQLIGVSDFVGIGLEDMIIDSTYSGKTVNTSVELTNVVNVDDALNEYIASPNDTYINVINSISVILGDISGTELTGKEIIIKNSSEQNLIVGIAELTALLIEGTETITLAPNDSVTLLNTGGTPNRFIII